MTTSTSAAPAKAIELRRVATFEGTGIEALSDSIFGDAARHAYVDGLMGPDVTARYGELCKSLPPLERIRIGAFDGERLVGYTSGWFEIGARFYIGSSAVHHDYRRQGVYTRLMREIETAVRERGGIAISSQHVAGNNAVLIAKLRLGYVIAGTEYTDQMGLLVRLVLNLDPARAALFAQRTGMLTPPGAS